MDKDIGSIYSLYVSDLFTYGQYLGFEDDTVKDAIHDVFVKMAIDSNKLISVNNIKFYLFRALKNRLLDILKNQKKQTPLDNTAPPSDIPFRIEVNVEDLIIEEEERKEIKAEIENMLDTLTPRQREIIYLRYVQEYDYDQIAELLQISVHGCRKLVSKAITTLRTRFGPLALFLV